MSTDNINNMFQTRLLSIWNFTIGHWNYKFIGVTKPSAILFVAKLKSSWPESIHEKKTESVVMEKIRPLGGDNPQRIKDLNTFNRIALNLTFDDEVLKIWGNEESNWKYKRWPDRRNQQMLRK